MARYEHTVSQMQLKRFAEKSSDKKFKIFRLKIDEPYSGKNPEKKDISKISGFYRWHGTNKEEWDFYEKEFSKLENAVSIILDKIESIKSIDILNKEDKKILSNFIYLQIIRVKKGREWFSWLFTLFARKEKVGIPANLVKNLDNTISAKIQSLIYKSILKDGNWGGVPEVISKLRWILIKNRTNIDFIISDNPVIILGMEDYTPKTAEEHLKIQGETFKDTSKTTILFPINTNLELVISGSNKAIYTIYEFYFKKPHGITYWINFNRCQSCAKEIYLKSADQLNEFNRKIIDYVKLFRRDMKNRQKIFMKDPNSKL